MQQRSSGRGNRECVATVVGWENRERVDAVVGVWNARACCYGRWSVEIVGVLLRSSGGVNRGRVATVVGAWTSWAWCYGRRGVKIGGAVVGRGATVGEGGKSWSGYTEVVVGCSG